MRLLIASLVLCTSLQAQTLRLPERLMVAPKSTAVAEAGRAEAEIDAWRLTVGYSIRSFNAKFKTLSPSVDDLSLPGNSASLNKYGGRFGLTFENGYVERVRGDGTAYGSIDVQEGRSWSLGSGSSFVSDVTSYSPSSLPDHSTVFFTDHTYWAPPPGEASAAALAYGPYVRLSNVLSESRAGSLGVSLVWTGLYANLESIDSFIGHPRAARYGFTYEVANPASFDGPHGFVVDAGQVNEYVDSFTGEGGGYHDPRRKVLRKNLRVPEWSAVSSSRLDVRLNEIFLSADVSLKPWRGLEVALSLGPTLNLVTTHLNSRSDWVGSDGSVVEGDYAYVNDTHLRVGLGAQTVLRQNLTRDGRAFLEAHGGYKWLNELAIDSPVSPARLDLGDWEFGLGVGIRLDEWPANSPWTVRMGAMSRSLQLHVSAPTLEPLLTGIELVNGFRSLYQGPQLYKSNQERIDSIERPGVTVDEKVAAPYLEFGRALWSVADWQLGFSMGIGATQASFEAFDEVSATVTTRRQLTQTELQERLQYPEFYDYGNSDRRGSVLYEHYPVMNSANVDVSTQSLFLGADLSYKPIKHLELGFAAGPTVNVVSSSTDLMTTWRSAFLNTHYRDHDNKTQVRLGVRMQASARYDLDHDGRWFAEARAGYERMQPIDLSIGAQPVSLEASVWQFGGGLGCRLGVKPKISEIRSKTVKATKNTESPERQSWWKRLSSKSANTKGEAVIP